MGDRLQVCIYYPNEICSNSVSFTPSNDTTTITGTNIYSDIPEDSCSTYIANPMWYAFTADKDGTITINTVSDIVMLASLLTGDSCNSTTCVEKESNLEKNSHAKSISNIIEYRVSKGLNYFLVQIMMMMKLLLPFQVILLSLQFQDFLKII